MKKNKTLLLVQDISLLNKIKSKDITFLFPVEYFVVGFPKTFKLAEINKEGFIFINRIMDNKGIEDFKVLISSLPSNIKGIVFDDIGVLNVLLETKIPITKILFLNHFNCNYESINSYLEYVDSVVVSPDITFDEIDEILLRVTKPVVLYTFGHVNIMYSRRTLITNYNAHFHKDIKNIASLEEKISNQKFKIIENIYGTVIYTKEPFNGLVLRNKNNVLYNLINTVFLTNEEVINILNSKDNLEDIYPYKYLSTKKTIVKIKEEEL